MNSSSTRYSSRRGFSLIEIMVVIALIGLILAIGIPYFATILHRSRVDGLARELNLTVLSARLQAIKRGTNITVGLSTDPASPFGPNTAVVFNDANANGAVDAGELIRADSLDPAGHRVTLAIDAPEATSPSTAPVTTLIVFSPFGSVASGGDKSVYIGDRYGNTLQVRVTTAATGRVTMTKLVPGATPAYQPPPWHWS